MNKRANTGYFHYLNPSKDGRFLLPVAERLKNESMGDPLLATAPSRRFDVQVIEFPGFIKVIASCIRSLFPAGMMVAALLLLLNVVVLINLPAPDIKESVGEVPMRLVVITPLIYLIAGTVSRLTISNQKFTYRVSIAVSAIPSTPSGRICKRDTQP